MPDRLNTATEIVVQLRRVEDIFRASPGPVACARLLNNDTEEFIVNEAAQRSRQSALTLKFVVPPEEIVRAEEIKAAVRTHFENRRKRSNNLLVETLRLGARRLLMGFAFLAVMYFLSHALELRFPQNGLSITVRELFIIFAWVALWRPADLLLYDWHPIKRDRNLYRRLEQCTVNVTTATRESDQ